MELLPPEDKATCKGRTEKQQKRVSFEAWAKSSMDLLAPEDKAICEDVRSSGKGICSQCRWTDGCAKCDWPKTVKYFLWKAQGRGVNSVSS